MRRRSGPIVSRVLCVRGLFWLKGNFQHYVVFFAVHETLLYMLGQLNLLCQVHYGLRAYL